MNGFNPFMPGGQGMGGWPMPGGQGGGNPMQMLGGASAGVGAMPPGGGINAILGGGNTPYAHGYGMGSPGEFQGYQTGPGIQDPQAMSGMEGGDLTKRGSGENYFGQTAGGYVTPGMNEKFAANSLNKYSAGTPTGTDLQGSNFARFSADRPNISAEPGLDKYYDRAVDRASTDINNQLAARGMYGSSGGVGRLEDAITDLRADQAKNEAQYNLQRLGEQRGWEGLAGQLAGGADQGSLARSANELGWLSGLGNLGQNADMFGLQRTQAGQNAANASQGLEQGRFGTMLGNELAMSDRMNGMMGDAYGNMLQTDQDLMNSSMGMGMGLASEALNQDYRTQEKIKADEQHGADMFGGVMGGMLGGL
ncbi:MAG TPA: hypothetical protein VIV12_12735 [Streptosporangiaceae bacterium]